VVARAAALPRAKTAAMRTSAERLMRILSTGGSPVASPRPRDCRVVSSTTLDRYSTNSASASGCAACHSSRNMSSSTRMWSCLTEDGRETSTVFGPTCSATYSRLRRKATRLPRSAASCTRILIRVSCSVSARGPANPTYVGGIFGSRSRVETHEIDHQTPRIEPPSGRVYPATSGLFGPDPGLFPHAHPTRCTVARSSEKNGFRLRVDKTARRASLFSLSGLLFEGIPHHFSTVRS
jgi:hypothetical protein